MKETIQNIILSLIAGTIIGGFLYYGQFVLATIIISVIVACYIVLQFLTFANNQWVQNENMIKILTSLMANQQVNGTKNEQMYFNRMTYLQDVLLQVKPETAHAINNVPEAPEKPIPNKFTMDFPSIDDVPVELIKGM
jgi:uncharacterized membrane protein